MKASILSRIILLCSLCIAMSTARAQYVSIPDTGFANYINDWVDASCLYGNSQTGWYLDTTCPAVLADTIVFCHTYNVLDFTGLKYFKSLRHLEIDGNYLSAFPDLPDSVTYLDCRYNYYDSIPSLPASLTYFDCSDNIYITSLPASLPPSLRYLNCAANALTNLPPLPSSLITLYAGSNHITSLPILPVSLDNLSCEYNPLTSLPTLPSSIRGVSVYFCQLTSLPALPASLKYLYCNNNPLHNLPTLPNGLIELTCENDSLTNLAIPDSLTILSCGGNQLTSLPALSPRLMFLECSGNNLTSLPSLVDSLTLLNCSYNHLNSLPALPAKMINLICSGNSLTSLPAFPAHLASLTCDSNQLSGLPDMPATLTTFRVRGNPMLSCLPLIKATNLYSFFIQGSNIHCLPNRFSASSYDIRPDTLPLCTPASGCDFYYDIAGNIHNDTAATCTLDSIHNGALLKNIKVQLRQNGQVIQQQYTGASGAYSFKTDSLVSYTVTLDTIALPLTLSCPASGIRSVSLSASDSLGQQHQDFGMQCGYTDYAVLALGVGRLRPLFLSTVYVDAGNRPFLDYSLSCGTSVAGTIVTTFSGPIHYNGPSLGSLVPSLMTGTTLTYNIADLNTLSSQSLNFEVVVDSTATIGDAICFTTIVSAAVPDAYPSNDTFKICGSIRNSHDPNLKEVYPTTLTPDGGWLTYTVHFQNTGNDTAYLVVLKDTLSQYVDASSFQYLASSHRAVIQLFGNAMVFTFPKINLVDSATNPPLSEGWIQYKVKAKANLPLQTQVKNTAYIYFDNNPAVVTNTTINTVDTLTHTGVGITPVTNSGSIHLYPNPNSGTFTLQTSNNIHSDYTITDMLGNTIEQKTITADHQQIDLHTTAAGVYTLTVKGASPLRFVVVR